MMKRASFEALARELTADLDPERQGALLDLDSERRSALFQSFYDLALELLDRLGMPEAEREEARTCLVILGQTALEGQGLHLLAAALYLLAHDKRASEEGLLAHFERVWFRFKLAVSLLLADEHDVENIRHCADLVRWTLPQADALWNQPGLSKDAFFDLQYRLHYWLAGRCKELDLLREALHHFSEASLAARTPNDRVDAVLGLADCYEKLGDPQRANEMLMLHDDEIAEVDDEETLERWTMSRNQLRFQLGGILRSGEDWLQAPQWSFLEKLVSAFLNFDRQPSKHTLADTVAAFEHMLDRTPTEDAACRYRLLTGFVVVLASHDLGRARAVYQQAKSLETQAGDEASKLKLWLVGARLLRHSGEIDAACAEYRSLLPAARDLLGEEERLSVLGSFLETLARLGDPSEAEEIRRLAGEALALFERRLRQHRGARARRRFREVHQRAFEGVLIALVGTAQRLSMESGAGQELLSLAWQVVLAIRNPELSRTATEPAPDAASHVRELEDDFHRLVRDHFVEGTEKDSWIAVLERLVEREITILRTEVETTQASFQPPAEGRALAFFQFRDLSAKHPVLVLGCRGGRIDAGLLPDNVSRSDGSIRELLPPSLAWAILSQGPWFFFLDGDLHYRSIESMPRGKDDLTWFGKDRGMQTCLRSTVHPATRRRIDFSRGWLGIGDVPGREKLSDLPNTRCEIEQVQAFLQERGCPAEALLGKQAGSIRFQERLSALRPSVLHFATHGCLDRAYPDAACLFLADSPGAPEGEMLPFRRIQELDLEGVDLVVLSACRSATGLSGRAAGYEGLAWAFLRAGAAQVLASRFSVGDTSTADLMGVFYRHLQHLPAAEALGRTRSECLANGMDPSEVRSWLLLS